MENLTEIVFILDRSGSMSGLETDTIGGYNSFLERQKKDGVKALVSTILFDDTSKVIHDRVDLAEIKPLTDRDYYVQGCTALLDAVGEAVRHIKTVQKYARPEDRPEKTIFVITTDGQENSSERYSYSDVKKMISQQKEQGWVFIFLGANIDAESVAESVGIDRSRAVKYKADHKGTEINFSVLGNIVSRFCREDLRQADFLMCKQAWAKDIEDYESGKK